MTNIIIGENIRTLRENAGFTQTNLALFLGVDQSLITRIEKGERSLSTDMLEKLASLFGVTVEQMEKPSVTISKLSFAFRGSKFTVAEMEAIAAINKIALNSEFMRTILEESKE
ncbi:MAG TPA: helix-turn-helix transcriptional regulator [Bacilli bacterium]|nr:MAG: helix-turn-helix protein [Tenericutes bacterium ADurb.BinA124]HQC74586.1 helix-turn-helix transcriptional regulator [Bacilli bacterium]